MNFRAIAHCDTWRLCASLHARQSLLKDGGTLLRIGSDWEPEADEKWTALRNLVARIERLPGHEKFESGDIRMLAVSAGRGTDWERGMGYDFLHLPIVTNPGVVTHSGMEARHIPVGLLTWVPGTLLGCMVNHGDYIAAHLTIEIRERMST